MRSHPVSLLFADQETFHRNNIESALLVLLMESRARRPLLRDDCRLPVGFGAGTLSTIAVLSAAELTGSALVPYLMLAASFAFIFSLTRLATSRRQRDAVHRLTEYDDLRSIGPLLDAIHWPETDVRMAARATLLRLLPQLRAAERGAFAGWLQSALCHAFRPGDFQLNSAVESALERVGDERAVPFLERLAGTTWRRFTDPRVCEAAARLIPILKERKATDPPVLLRPAFQETAIESWLLRATEPRPESYAHELGRAVEVVEETVVVVN